MQNGKLWLLTMRNKIIVKASVEDSIDKPKEVDDDILKRKNIKKMLVDPKGIHCFMLAEHELYYNHWTSNKVFKVETANDQGANQNVQPKAFKSIDIAYVSAADPTTFEILLGTDDGLIYHACFSFNGRALETLDPFVQVLDTRDYRPLLDIKIARLNNKILILAVTDSILY